MRSLEFSAIYQVQGFSRQLKNGWFRSTGVGGFIFPPKRNFWYLKLVGGFLDAIFSLMRFFFRKGQIVTLINSSSSISPRFQHKIVLLAVLSVFTVGFSSFC